MRRRLHFVTLLVAVLLAHALLLWGSGPRADDDRQPVAMRTVLLTRQLVAVPTAPSPAPSPAAAHAAPAAPLRQAARAATTPAIVSTASDPAALPDRETAAADTRDPPVYATRLPAPVHLRFLLLRGAASGTADLRWHRDGAHYQLQIDGSAGAGQPLLAWDSVGTIDAAGVAPDRFVDRRRRRGAMAVNFQRDRGLITFSGPQLQYTLLPGAQDRASWLLQLAAVVAADPARFVAGERIDIFVAGARGDAEAWTFGIEGVEALDLPAGPVTAALHLLREPRRPYDTRAEVWLDPARQHLPVRVRLQRVPSTGGDATELLLQDVVVATPP